MWQRDELGGIRGVRVWSICVSPIGYKPPSRALSPFTENCVLGN